MFQFMFLKNANVWNFQLKMHQDIHFGNVVLMVQVIFLHFRVTHQSYMYLSSFL